MMYQIMAIVIMAIFYGCYFLKMITQRRKGIQTDHIGKNKKGFIKFIEVTMKVVTYITPVAELISIGIGKSILSVEMKITGIVLGCLGVAVFICSVLTMRDSWRAGVSENEKTDLVTEGIYQISRNPAFLGFDLVYIGILLMFFNWILFGISLFAVVMLHLQIVNVEEDFLITAFGEEYINYRKKVNRYLGRKIQPLIEHKL